MKSLSYLNKFFWKYKYRLLLGIVFVTCSNVFDVFRPLLIQQAIDFLISTSENLSSFPVTVKLPPIFEGIVSWFDLSIFRLLFIPDQTDSNCDVTLDRI